MNAKSSIQHLKILGLAALLVSSVVSCATTSDHSVQALESSGIVSRDDTQATLAAKASYLRQEAQGNSSASQAAAKQLEAVMSAMSQMNHGASSYSTDPNIQGSYNIQSYNNSDPSGLMSRTAASNSQAESFLNSNYANGTAFGKK